MDKMQKLTKSILEHINEYLKKNGDMSNGEIIGSLEWSKLSWYNTSIKNKT